MQSIGLQQNLAQTTKLTPTQIQVIRMLELPSIELSQRINEELQENPALEEGRDEAAVNEHGDTLDEFDDNYMPDDGYDDGRQRDPLQNEDFNYEQYVSDDETPSYMLHQQYSPADEDRREVPIIGGSSLIEELKAQIYLTNMTKPQRHIAKWVLGNIDDDGYLRRTTEQLVDDLMFQEQIPVTDEEMASIVQQIKQFDPPGIASFDLQECLIKQLEVKLEDDPDSAPIQMAIEVLSHYFEHFSKHHFDYIKQRLKCTDEQFQDAVQEIMRLNQKPANAMTGSVYDTHKETIIPDFSIEERDNELYVVLNTGDIPELHVSREYSNMLEEYNRLPKTKDTRQAKAFIKQKLSDAQLFIDAIKQRNETLMKTMSAILQMQYDFFLDGETTSLKPMVLQDIADRTGYDVSTISRVSNSKYVETRYGIYPLKYFFSEGMTNAEGDEISTHEIKKILQELIDKEDKHNPLTDEQLVEELSRHGYPIARRTVAKYRDLLNIPVARLRKTV
ncbi:MAG: RNA polymerase factor sigma-54 [Paludibacteraceae bacterium]|nr:RNA polymerase factor sigma-54 [Paludibacteraceae bacterium]MBQ4018641.1 RNA polymerase factor sigma-54 [Paludibacteraceae bacterium]